MTHSGAHSHQMVELVFETGCVCMQAFDLFMTEKYIGLGGGEGKRRKEKEESGGAEHVTFLLLQLSHTCPPTAEEPCPLAAWRRDPGFCCPPQRWPEGLPGTGERLGEQRPRKESAGRRHWTMDGRAVSPACWANAVVPTSVG